MGLHTFRRHASPPRATADGVYWTLVRSPRRDFFSSSGQKFPSGPLRVASPLGYVSRQLHACNVERKKEMFVNAGHNYVGNTNCSEQIFLQAVMNVHNLSLAGYCEQDRLSLNRWGPRTGRGDRSHSHNWIWGLLDLFWHFIKKKLPTGSIFRAVAKILRW